MYTLTSSKMTAITDEQGALVRLTLAGDPYETNFLLDPAEEPWLLPQHRWGLGFIRLGHTNADFSAPDAISLQDGALEMRYHIDLSDPRFACVWNGDPEKSRQDYRLEIAVRRWMQEDGLYETYRFTNTGDRYLALDEIGLFSGLHDVYAVGKDMLSKRVNEHICAAGDLCYIAGVRQSGRGPHVGMITLEGSFDAYHTEDVNTSNVRGAIAMVAHRVRIAAGETWQVRRVVLSFADQADFARKLTEYTGFPRLDYGCMTLTPGQDIRITVREAGSLCAAYAGGVPMTRQGDCLIGKPAACGTTEVKLRYGAQGEKLATAQYCTIPNVHDLLEARANFIRERQQIHDPADPLCGAYMPYDIYRDEILRLDKAEKLYYSVPDRNDARERVNMGAFMARWYRGRLTPEGRKTLEDYAAFLERWIVDEKGDVWDCYLRQASAKYYGTGLMLTQDGELDMRFRACNWGIVIAFYYEMFKTTGERRYYDMVLRLMDASMARHHQFTGLGLWKLDVLRELYAQGDTDRGDVLLENMKAEAKQLAEHPEEYEAGEVAYEQFIAASNVVYLCELYLFTHDDALLPAIEVHRRMMMSFEGEQPDFRLRHMPIRHWDGYWFGGNEMWGDTMPHYWNTISAYAHAKYAQVTGDEASRERAREIYYGNLTLIQASGACYNTYIFPEEVNGRPGACADPLANDQECAYYYFLKDFGEEVQG